MKEVETIFECRKGEILCMQDGKTLQQIMNATITRSGVIKYSSQLTNSSSSLGSLINLGWNTNQLKIRIKTPVYFTLLNSDRRNFYENTEKLKISRIKNYKDELLNFGGKIKGELQKYITIFITKSKRTSQTPIGKENGLEAMITHLINHSIDKFKTKYPQPINFRADEYISEQYQIFLKTTSFSKVLVQEVKAEFLRRGGREIEELVGRALNVRRGLEFLKIPRQL